MAPPGLIVERSKSAKKENKSCTVAADEPAATLAKTRKPKKVRKANRENCLLSTDDGAARSACARAPDIENHKTSKKENKKKRKLSIVDVTDGAVAEPMKKRSKNGESVPSMRPSLELLAPEEYLKAHDVRVFGANVPPPAQRFQDLDFPQVIHQSLQSAGFPTPSAIQAQSWPVALQGRDCLAIAKTGSGKTLGYLLPIMTKILALPMSVRKAKINNVNGPLALVVAPTRELAIQIQDEAAKFGAPAGVRSTCVYGGASKGPQIREMRYGLDLIIATPGRLLDFATMVCRFDNCKLLTLAKASMLVLDEADRMLDMGFEKDIRSIVNELPKERHTLFFTATWPKAVQRIANDILKPDKVQINLGELNQLTANKDVTQMVKVLSDHRAKFDEMKAILDGVSPEMMVIVFCNKKRDVHDIETSLWNSGARVGSIHGDKTQDEREYTLGEFKTGKMPILIATDVAARGLDIKGVDMVINYDFPTQTEDYIHRIGRTGRAGAKGIAHTFFTNIDKSKARELVKIMEDAKQEHIPAELRSMATRFSGGSGGRGGWRGGGRGRGARARGSGRGGRGRW